jgi:Leucine-rich repeat (LRR) protein
MEISHIDDISMCVALYRLDLSKNKIAYADALSGLKHCKTISYLNLSQNALTTFDGVQHLPHLLGE